MDEHKKSELSELSRTCKLWLSYTEYIFFVQELSELKKETTGNHCSNDQVHNKFVSYYKTQ